MGRVQLVKSIIHGMLVSSFHVYMWPRRLLDDLDKWIKNFILSGDVNTRKLCTVSWKGKAERKVIIALLRFLYLTLSICARIELKTPNKEVKQRKSAKVSSPWRASDGKEFQRAKVQSSPWRANNSRGELRHQKLLRADVAEIHWRRNINAIANTSTCEAS
ncbi:hypothetical protein MTR_4g063625 [Medicago truncatula]|uniref:Uncharacterized protein n=1 Tax=Medicago truncatula TaxID=3880 RepID=A0A072UK37_MEDTR|nr:hypothetical protein MTR_4g063625 [Medicago truncatula]